MGSIVGGENIDGADDCPNAVPVPGPNPAVPVSVPGPNPAVPVPVAVAVAVPGAATSSPPLLLRSLR